MASMRLRLTLLRPSLPPIKTLWPLPAGSQTLTISALLTLLSATFPLDSPTLGLETYTLSIGGYEALHWQEVGSVLKDDDEVIVRAISGNEVRARRLGGREGVTADGRRVLDGVAWGRGRGRGEVVVKRGREEEELEAEEEDEDEEDEDWEGETELRERKRVKFTVAVGEGPGEAEDEEEAWLQQRLIEGPPLGGHRTLIPFGGEDDSEDDEEDGDFEGFEAEDSEESDVESDEAVDGDEDSSSNASTESDDSSDDDDEEDESSGSSTSTDSSSASSDESSEEIIPAERKESTVAASTSTAAAKKQTTVGASKTQQLLNGLFSLTPNETSATATAPAGTLTNGKATNIPHEGLHATKARNIRRRDTKKLKHLKDTGVLPAAATLADLAEYQKGNVGGRTAPSDDQVMVDVNQPLKAVNDVDDIDGGAAATAEGTAKRAPEADSEVMARKRRRLLNAIESGGIEINSQQGEVLNDEDYEAPDELSSKQADVPMTNGHSSTLKSAAAESPLPAVDGAAETTTRRTRLDLTGSQRHIFASLGVRAPKSDEQKEALRKKLASRRGPSAKAAIAALAASGAAATEPEQPATAPESEYPTTEPEITYHWSDRIDLRAVECVDENVTLSTPPYPFHQRWDPQYHKRKNRNKAAYTSGKKGKRQADQHVETYDKYFPDQEGDYLDYGDEDGGEEDEGYWDDNALLGDEDPSALQLQAEANATTTLNTDLPALPEDVTSLLLLLEEDAALGDIITYNELVCEAATSWQPKMLARTAELVEKDFERGEWGIRLAVRDMPQKNYDEEGNRVYAKFEMEGGDEGEDGDVDERAKVLSWSEMGEVRLVKKVGT